MTTTTISNTHRTNNHKRSDKHLISIAGQLKLIYGLTIYFCCFMFIWIVIFPSSWMIGRFDSITFHKDIFLVQNQTEATRLLGPVPPDYFFKYAGHTAVHLTHHLPGAIWIASIPVQFNTNIRSKYKKFHRMNGYLLLTSSGVLCIGIVIIMIRKLTTEDFFPDLPPRKFNFSEVIITATSLWFLYTAYNGWKYASMKEYKIHSYWITRHVSAGIWPAVMRTIVGFLGIGGPYTRQGQRDTFLYSSWIATLLCILGGEYTIFLMKRQNSKQLELKKET